MKCSFSRLLYPKRLEEARDGSYMIALFKPNEKLLDAQGNRLSSIKVVGHFLPTVAGVKVDMTGHWKKDARYGLQFEMESYEEIVGSDKRSIVAYLSSGMIPGIGTVLAERIYNTFGAQTLEVLDQPCAYRGSAWHQQEEVREVLLGIYGDTERPKTHQHVGTLQYQRTAGNQAAGAAGIGCAGPSHTVSLHGV